jgi:hypothetical protein
MMKTWGWALLGLVGAFSPVRADAPDRRVEDVWESAHVDGVRTGFLHTSVRPVEGTGGKRLRATADLQLTFRRYGSLLRLHLENGTEETPEGRVLGVFMRQLPERGQPLVVTGEVEDGKLHVRGDGGRLDRRIRWSDEVVGLARQGRLFQERRPKTGDRFSFLRYEPTLTTVVTVRVAVKDVEEVSGRKLLRVELTPDRVEAVNASVQLPGAVWWLDDDFVPVRRQIELEGLGAVLLVRTTREKALAAPETPARGSQPRNSLPDIGLKSLVPLDRTIARPHATRSVVYRVTLNGDADPATALVRDAHQEIRNVKGNSFELHVHPVRPAGAARRPGGEKEGPLSPAIGEEYLASCPFIDCDDARIKDIARRAVADETDPWRKARRLERWVKQSMRPDNSAPLAPASEVARQLRGDCRLYALLLAALCRAEGVPSRTAIGLVYVEKGRRPFLGFHMWTEVYVDGRWLGLDGTLGQGGVGATHVKITDHGWQGARSLTPLLPVTRVLGKLTVEVVRVEGD